MRHAIETLAEAARGRTATTVRGSWTFAPAGAPVPADVPRDDLGPGEYGLEMGSWGAPFQWKRRPGPGKCGSRYVRNATDQEVRDYVGACVRLGLLTFERACQIQEFACNRGKT